MATTKLKERASAIRKAADHVFVFAASDRSVPKRTAVVKSGYTAHTCGDCGTVVEASSHTSKPFCVTCGSHHVKATSESVELKIEASDLTSIRCGCCNSSNVTSKKILAAAEGKIHCVTCGTAVTSSTFKTKASEDMDPAKLDGAEMLQNTLKVPDVESFETTTPVDEPFTPDLQDKKETKTAINAEAVEEPKPAVMDGTPQSELNAPDGLTPTTPENDKSVEVADLGDEGFADMEDPSLDILDDVETSGSEMWDEGIEPDPETEATAADDLELNPKPEPEDLSTADALDGDGDFDDMGVEDFDGEPLTDALDMDDTAKALAFVAISANKLVAMKHGVSIASLHRKDAGKNADIIHDAVFATAVESTANDQGLRATLASFGFKPYKVKAASKTVVEKQVTAKVAEIAAVQAGKEKVLAECLALASVGLSQGRWKQKPNVLQAAVEKEFARLGVRNPKSITASVFAKYGIEYTQTLVEVATKLQSYTSEGRKELADMFEMTESASVAVEADHAADEMPDNDYRSPSEDVTARLSQPAVPVLLQSSRTTASSHLQKAQDILSGKASLSFGD